MVRSRSASPSKKQAKPPSHPSSDTPPKKERDQSSREAATRTLRSSSSHHDPMKLEVDLSSQGGSTRVQHGPLPGDGTLKTPRDSSSSSSRVDPGTSLRATRRTVIGGEGPVHGALFVPGYSVEQAHFLLWYYLTTTVSVDTIASLFNRWYQKPPAEQIDRWAVLDLVNELEDRFTKNGMEWFKEDDPKLRLKRPVDTGTCPCDLGIDCVDVKRTPRTRTNERYLTMAEKLWDQPASLLVMCPRGKTKTKTKKKRDAEMARREQGMTRWRKLFRDGVDRSSSAYLSPILRVFVTVVVWLSAMDLWFIPMEKPVEEYGVLGRLASVACFCPGFMISLIHWVLRGVLDCLPTLRGAQGTQLELLTVFARSFAYNVLGLGSIAQLAVVLCWEVGSIRHVAVGERLCAGTACVEPWWRELPRIWWAAS